MTALERLEKMRERIFEMMDTNNPYSEEDFNKEFSENTTNIEGTKFNLLFTNKTDNPNPEYATDGSSGFDLRANLSFPVIVKAYAREVVPTGLFFEIPDNLEIQVRPRSGLAAKHGVTVLNSPGTVDSDYRGEVKVILANLSDEDFIINHGDRIAQAVVAPVISKRVLNLKEVKDVGTNTNRGANGFGSTGSK